MGQRHRAYLDAVENEFDGCNKINKENKVTQLYATIKKTSRYAAQQSYHLDEKGKPLPFEVEIPENANELRALGGIGGNYDIKDLNYFIKHNDKFVKIHR